MTSLTPLLEVLLEHGGHFGIPMGQDLTSRHHERHVGTERLEDVVNSTPVTPDPITIHLRRRLVEVVVQSRVVRTRLPSTGAQSGMRGLEPVEIIALSNRILRSAPSFVVTTASLGSVKRPILR